jgi:hypothetical protein
VLLLLFIYKEGNSSYKIGRYISDNQGNKKKSDKDISVRYKECKPTKTGNGTCGKGHVTIFCYFFILISLQK